MFAYIEIICIIMKLRDMWRICLCCMFVYDVRNYVHGYIILHFTLTVHWVYTVQCTLYTLYTVYIVECKETIQNLNFNIFSEELHCYEIHFGFIKTKSDPNSLQVTNFNYWSFNDIYICISEKWGYHRKVDKSECTEKVYYLI